MTPEQQAAFIMAQVAIAMARIAGMQAENQYRAIIGMAPVYRESNFQEAANEDVLGHNAVISFFRGL